MISKAYHPSYYRNHVYSHQFNMPDSAFLNRKIPQYVSELPQGQSPFIKSNKKHYRQIGYKSIIAQQNIINNQSDEQSYSPAKNKSYLRNLNITDIEGANPNTIVSQAIKNRIKAKQNVLRVQKNKVHQLQKYTQGLKTEINQQQELQKMKNQQRRRLKTQNNEKTYSFHYNKPNQLTFKQELQINEEEMEYLKKKLQIARKKAQSLNYQNYQANQNQKPQETNPKRKDFSFIKLQPIQFISKSGQRKQSNDIPTPTSNTHNQQERRYKSSMYPQQDHIIESQNHMKNNLKELQKHNAELKNSNKQLRGEIRKLNPTYLSIDILTNKLLNNLNTNSVKPM